MRDIAAAVGMMSGSIYYHFASKEELFVAVCKASIEKIARAVRTAIATVDDPWARLEAAVAAHCEALHDPSDFKVLMVATFPPGLEENARRELVAQRDEYERVLAPLIDTLDLAPAIDRRMFRLYLLGAINWTPIWYRPGNGLEPADLARQMIMTLRNGMPGPSALRD